MNGKIKTADVAITAAGGNAELARKLLGEPYKQDEFLRMQSRISKWRKNGIPPKWVLSVERATGFSRHVLAPDLYPNESTA